MQEKTKRIIKEDIESVRAYADAFNVPMPDLDENGEVVGLPAPYPREVAGVVRSCLLYTSGVSDKTFEGILAGFGLS